MKVADSIRTKILIPFRLFPKEGLTPEKLAFSITIGLVAGLFPVIGATTLISLLLAMLFRQNLLIVQSVQWIVAVIQILLIIPFMQMGAYILSDHSVHISMQQISLAFQPGIVSGIKTVGILHLYAILTWTLLAIPGGTVSYLAFRTVFQKKDKI